MLVACGQDDAPRTGTDAERDAAHGLLVGENADKENIETAGASYQGSEACVDCHAEQFEQWQGSHHQLAMQEASSATVLGDFNAATASSHGQSFEFTSREQGYFVRTLNEQSEPQEFAVSHTFGVSPLQQYLVSMPNGAVQALPMAWDTNSKADGGQRWFHLYQNEAIEPDDRLHWTGPLQNWNHQCADCHSTNMQKNATLDQSSGQLSFEPTFSDLNVGCEACHGPGSKHIAWADGQTVAAKNKGFNADINDAETQLFTCARCHSRREMIAEEFTPDASFYDHYLPALLRPGLYHYDGQIDDEVFVFGSFVQSKMHQAGVRCNDCHNGHSTELKLPGNQVCTQCHSETGAARFDGLQSKIYDSPAHHFHPQGSTGGECKNCHMPLKAYMVNDPRHDHSFKIPRPDLSERLGVPNTCTSCHEDKTNNWATKAIRQWADESGGKDSTRIDTPHFAEVFAQASQLKPGAAVKLANIANDENQPEIVRASALLAAVPILNAQVLAAAETALRSHDVLRQTGALRALENLPIERLWPLAAELLSSPHRVVRVEAARVLAAAPTALLSEPERNSLNIALKEYRASQMLNQDRPEAWGNLGALELRQGNPLQAQEAFRQAIALDESWLPAYLNLADLERQLGNEAGAETYLQRALQLAPDNAEAHHAMGLWLSRAGRQAEAVEALKTASDLNPEHWHYRYVYAIGLNSSGNSNAAIAELERATESSPENTELLFALATIHRDLGNINAAKSYAQQLLGLSPNDPRATGLLRALDR